MYWYYLLQAFQCILHKNIPPIYTHGDLKHEIFMEQNGTPGTWQKVYCENWYMNIQLNLGLQNPHLALVGKLLCVDFLFSTFSDSAWPV